MHGEKGISEFMFIDDTKLFNLKNYIYFSNHNVIHLLYIAAFIYSILYYKLLVLIG